MNNNTIEIEDEDEFEDEKEYSTFEEYYADAERVDDFGELEDFLNEEQDWDDASGLGYLYDYHKIPKTWHLVKLFNFHWNTLAEVDEWLSLNCTCPYKRIGWSSGCSSRVGVTFESPTDALMFKLMYR